MPDPAISWIIIAILLILTCFFSAAETAFACCNRYKVQVEADEGKKYAKILLKILDNYNRALTTVLIGTNVLAIAVCIGQIRFCLLILPKINCYG